MDCGLKDSFTVDFPPEFRCLLSDNKLTFWFSLLLVLTFLSFFITEFLLSLFIFFWWYPIESLGFEFKLNFHWLIRKQIKTRKLEGKFCWKVKSWNFENLRKKNGGLISVSFFHFKERRFHWLGVCNFHSTISLRHRNSRGWIFWRHGRPHRGQAGEQQTFIPPRIRTLSPQPQSHRGNRKGTVPLKFSRFFYFSLLSLAFSSRY